MNPQQRTKKANEQSRALSHSIDKILRIETGSMELEHDNDTEPEHDPAALKMVQVPGGNRR